MIRPVSLYFDLHASPATWVLAGKGPSFARRDDAELDGYPVFGLNHVCLHRACELAHFTDLDAFADCAEALLGQTGGVVLPWYPHVGNRPGPLALSVLAETTPQIGRLAKAGRLFSYNSDQARRKAGGLPTHHVRYFSAVVALDILVRNRVKTVLTLGVDGGKAYAPEFDTKTLLSNGRPSFDAQFGEMKRIADRKGVTVRPLVEAPPQCP